MSLFLRNLFFTVLQPGIVAGLVPYAIVRATGEWRRPTYIAPGDGLGLLIAVLGTAVLLVCIARFATEGRGTLSPLDPTKRLVVKGLYKYSRNPMYVGVMLILIGEAILFRSLWLAAYAIVSFIAFSLFIRLHEEPRLRRDFGEDYQAYKKKVTRWL